MNGIIIIDKPQGFTSQDVVSKVKKILNIKKAGHIGTLDPLATGVFPVLLNDATKLSKYLIEHDKAYIAKIKLGEKRSTGDLEGEIIETSDVIIKDKEKVLKTLEYFIGEQVQIPPIYSSIKVKGKKLYEYAREGKIIDIPAREIEIYDTKLTDFSIEEQEIEFKVSCSKGTYIRTLCEDIAEELGTCGFMSYLKRIQVGSFNINDSMTLEELENLVNNNEEKIENKIISIKEILKDYPSIVLSERKEELFLNGVKLTFDLKDGLYNIYSKTQEYIGLGVIKDKLLKRDIVIN